jgi:hypothetical protein
MKARKLIEGASYDPPAVHALCKAFDDAWTQIAPQVRNRTDAIEAARMNLANIILGLAKNGTNDVQALTDAAVQAMLDDPTKLGP